MTERKPIEILRNAGGADSEDILGACASAASAIELAYGMIWHVPVDKATEAGRCASIARLVLLAQLDRAGQARGIAAAKERILRDRESRTNSRTPADDVANALIRIGKRRPD